MPAQSGQEHDILISFGVGNRPSASRQTRSITFFDSLPCRSSTIEPTEPAQSAQIAFQRDGRGDRDVDLHLVDFRAAHQRLDLAARDLQVDDRAIADIGAPARQPVFVVGIAFEIVAPRLAPEALGDLTALDDDRRNDAPLLLELLDLLQRVRRGAGRRARKAGNPKSSWRHASFVAASRSSLTRSMQFAVAEFGQVDFAAAGEQFLGHPPLRFDQFGRFAPRSCHGRRICARERCASARCGTRGRSPGSPPPGSTSGRNARHARPPSD